VNAKMLTNVTSGRATASCAATPPQAIRASS
jgi:hypothetical protein